MEGDVSGEILEIANKEKVSLVIMGAHGKSLIEGILLGSVAANVLRYGKAHVLIARNETNEPNRFNGCSDWGCYAIFIE